MKFFGEILEGTFISRHNRFIVYAMVSGKKERTYMPNPGRLLELLYPDSKLYFEKRVIKTEADKNKIPLTVVAVESNGELVMLHTHKANDVVEYLLKLGKIESLKGFGIVKREAKYDRSRMDFLLSKGNKEFFLEVKSCTLFDKTSAMFPDAVTERGKKHLEELMDVKVPHKKMGRSKVLFLVSSSKVNYFMPDYHTDIEFSLTLLKAKDKLDIIPLSVGWQKDLTLKPKIKELTIPWNIIRDECKDRGYVIVSLLVEKKKTVQIGDSLVTLPKGHYLFTHFIGEGMSKQIESIKRGSKNSKAGVITKQTGCKGVLSIRTGDDISVELEKKLKNISNDVINGAGIIFYRFNELPFKTKAFQDMLLYFRMGRLKKRLGDKL